jgi:hypothetical protein
VSRANGDLDGTLTPRVVKPNRNLLAVVVASGRQIKTGAGSREQQYSTYRALGQRSAKAITVELLRSASRGSADQRRFADRGIRIVTLALGGDLGYGLGCIAITHPISRLLLHPMTQVPQVPDTDPHALLQYVSFFR